MPQAHPLAQVMQHMPMWQIIVLLVAAFIGAIVSVLARFRYFLDCAKTAPLLVYVTVATKPFVSIAFALFIYAVVGSGLITLPGISLDGANGNYVAWVIGFLSGFSERFVQDFLAEAGRVAEPVPIASDGAAALKSLKAPKDT